MTKSVDNSKNPIIVWVYQRNTKSQKLIDKYPLAITYDLNLSVNVHEILPTNFGCW